MQSFGQTTTVKIFNLFDRVGGDPINLLRFSDQNFSEGFLSLGSDVSETAEGRLANVRNFYPLVDMGLSAGGELAQWFIHKFERNAERLDDNDRAEISFLINHYFPEVPSNSMIPHQLSTSAEEEKER